MQRFLNKNGKTETLSYGHFFVVNSHEYRMFKKPIHELDFDLLFHLIVDFESTPLKDPSKKEAVLNALAEAAIAQLPGLNRSHRMNLVCFNRIDPGKIRIKQQ